MIGDAVARRQRSSIAPCRRAASAPARLHEQCHLLLTNSTAHFYFQFYFVNGLSTHTEDLHGASSTGHIAAAAAMPLALADYGEKAFSRHADAAKDVRLSYFDARYRAILRHGRFFVDIFALDIFDGLHFELLA